MKEEEVDETPSTPVKTKEAAPATVAADEPGFTAVGKDGKGVATVTTENVLLKLREVLESRGKKVYSTEQHSLFVRLMTIYTLL